MPVATNPIELGIIEYLYTLNSKSTMEEKFHYYRNLNKFVNERVWATGLHPIRVRVDFIGIKKGKLQYSLTDRRV